MSKNLQPLISVIVPVYNSEKYIEDCIVSILNQTYPNLEILLVDDGSTDSSGDICEAYASKDQRIKVMHKPNGGQADARNLGMKSAMGAYVGFVDSDDTIENDMYEHLLNACLMHDSDIAMCARYNVDEITKHKSELFALPAQQIWGRFDALKRFLIWDCIDGSPCDKLFAREIIDNIEYPLGLISEDIPFVYQALKKAERVIHIGVPKYNYLQRNNSTSRSKISHRTIGLVKYPFEIRNDILQNFPDLIEYADYFYYSRELIFIKQLLDESYTADARDRMCHVRKHGWRLIRNRQFNLRQKIYIFLIIIHAFRITYYLFVHLKGKNS